MATICIVITFNCWPCSTNGKKTSVEEKGRFGISNFFSGKNYLLLQIAFVCHEIVCAKPSVNSTVWRNSMLMEKKTTKNIINTINSEFRRAESDSDEKV